LDLTLLEAAAPDFPGLAQLRHCARVGASIGYTGDRTATSFGRNGPSLKKFPAEWRTQVNADMALGRLVHPVQVGVKVVKAAALHLIPKSHPETRVLGDGVRLICDSTRHDHPDAVNANIKLAPPAPIHRYMSMRRLKRRMAVYITKYGKFYMGVSDAKAAFRRIRVRLKDWELMGLDTELPEVGMLLSTVLTFGLRSSPRSWVTLEDGMIWALRAVGVDAGAFVDDAYVLAASYNQCLEGVKRCIYLHDATGAPACRTKLQSGGMPDTTQEYTGIVWSASPAGRGSMSFTAKKLAKYVDQLRLVATRSKLPAKVVASVKGRMAHACTVYEQAKPWSACWHRVDTTNTSMVIRITHEMARCAKFMARVMSDRVGCHIVEPTTHRVQMYTDASTSTGYGAHMGAAYLYGRWSVEEAKVASIFTYELYTVVLAVVVFGDLIRGRRVVLHCDNQAVVACLNSLKAPTAPGGDWLLQYLVRHLIRLHARLDVRWISTHANKCADDLSRGRVPVTLPMLSYAHGAIVATQTSGKRCTPWRVRAPVWDRWRRYSLSPVPLARGRPSGRQCGASGGGKRSRHKQCKPWKRRKPPATPLPISQRSWSPRATQEGQ
jgi:hypothetical protein